MFSSSSSIFDSKYFLIFFLSLLFATNLSARDIPILTERVTDEASIFTVEEWTRIRDRVLAIEEKTSAQIFIYVIPSLEGENLESYSIAVAQKSGIGQKGKDNGVLLFMSTGDRKVRIEVGYGLEETLTDVYCNRIIKNIMIPLFKEGNLSGGVSEGVEALISILLGNVDSNPNLQNEYPDGYHTVVFPENTVGNQFVIAIIVSIFSFILYFFLNESKTFRTNLKVRIGYLSLVALILLIFAYSAVILGLLIGLGVLNFYLLYFYEKKYSYLLSLISLTLWIPIAQMLFASEFLVTSIVFGCISTILFLFKIFNDSRVLGPLEKFARKLNTGLVGLFFHFLGLCAFAFGVKLLFDGYPVGQTISILGLLLLTIYGFGYGPIGYKFQYYLIGIMFWVFLEFILMTLPTPTNPQNFFEFETLLYLFQAYLYIVPAFLIAKYWEVESWKIRIFKYAVITLLWVFAHHLNYLMGYEESFEPVTFLVYYSVILVIHFFVVTAAESGAGGGGSYSSSSSYGGSSSYSSSSSSSSSGGGGGSFGGGGSSGSW